MAERNLAVPVLAVKYLACCLAALVSSCGLENYIYLEPVESAWADSISVGHVILPNNSGNAYFRNYIIFYRIYISNFLSTNISTSDQRSQINSALASHYNTLDPYTTNDNVSPNAVGSVFSSLRYYQLEVSDNDNALDQLLGSGYSGTGAAAAGVNITIDFSGSLPFITLTSDPLARHFELYRTSSALSGFTPLPNRLFINTTGSGNLADGSIVTGSVNADVQPLSGNPSGMGQHTYVSMYILATGIDDNYSVIYSRPKHIGIFMLP